jgi:hypothetical protein
VQADNDSSGGVCLGGDAQAIDGEECVGHGESGELVAVDDGMILRQALPERGGLFDQVGVVTGLGPEQSLGFPDEKGNVVLFSPDRKVPLGSRLF